MESRGLDLWKADMKRLLESLNSARAIERDFATRDKLEMLCETMRDFMERAFTLELGLDRRIKCGSDIIVRNVIQFLENEPVEETITKIVDSGY